MSIINEIKKNVTEAANIASKKTTELTGIAKLKVNIQREKTKLSDCYKEIGRLFYTAERSGADHTSDIAAYIMQADKIKANIAGYKAELSRLRKVTICEGCGTEISNTAAYCSVCGAKQMKKCAAEEANAEPCCCCEDIEDTAEDVVDNIKDTIEDTVDRFEDAIENLFDKDEDTENTAE